MSDTLFDPGPGIEPAAEPLSATQRLTVRNRAQLDRGIHPATGYRLAGNGQTCATCAHHVVVRWHNRIWHKCARHRLGESHSAASDIRTMWPACTLWEARP